MSGARVVGRTLPLAVVLAGGVLAFAFRGRLLNFWTRLALGVGLLGLVGLTQGPSARRLRLTRSDVATGALSASLLYLVFQVGDRLARRMMPSGSDEIAAIYRLRREAPRGLIALLLGAVIAPGEELFWRGFVQARLARWCPAWLAVCIASALYAAIHLSARNLTLVAAAGVAGLFWGSQFALQHRLAPVIVSHILWDIWIFLIRPTSGDRAEARER